MRLVQAFLLASTLWLATAMPALAQSLIRDAEIEETLREWTDPILEVAGLEPNDVGLYIINDPSLNAFVAGGQRIHLHTGLIMASDNARQVKGVIAHETCHIACGHTVTRTRAASVASRPALVSIGLGVLAIAAGAPDAGAALIASSQQFAALNFFVHTRAEEAMADTMAVQYLIELEQSPMGIVEFFEKFRYQEVLSEARRYPYFRSHPLSSNRVRTTRTLAEESGLADKPEDPRVVKQFEMMKAKLVGFLEPPARVFRDYPPTDLSQPARYARAISAMQVADLTTALSEIDSLIEEEPENAYFHELKGQILFETGKPVDSVEPLLEANRLLPGNALLQISLARSLLARAEPGDMEIAENALRDALIAEPNNAFAWTQLAIVFEQQDNRPMAQVATAEAAYNIGNYPRAYSFAERAIRELEPNTPAFRQASDIRNATDPALPENEVFWRRRR
ncbi:MAG: M48 family metalloprotease [Henriciella sp.]|nr:M48 family metalloprotease [Hyphomonadaceae bacterium]